MDGPVCCHGHEYAENSLKEKYPRPSRFAAYAGHLCDAPGEDTSECPCEGCCREEKSHPETTFTSHVPDLGSVSAFGKYVASHLLHYSPLRYVVVDSREQATFEHTEEDACSHQARIILHKPLQDHCQRPEEHDEG